MAGFQYYEGERLWPSLKPGDPLTLVREPANPYDDKAVSVYWRAEKLGYIPRTDNLVIANIMDQGALVEGFIKTMQSSKQPWEKLEISILLSKTG